MKSLPNLKEFENDTGLANQIWEDVVQSMTEYTHDNTTSKFIPPEEMLIHIRPIAAAFSLLHYTPLPTIKEIYKSHLYSLFCFSIICGTQMYIKERSIYTQHAPFVLELDPLYIREAKNKVIRQLTDGIKVFSPINEAMDIFLTNLLHPHRLEHLPLKNAEFDRSKFDMFMPVTLLWGYLFAKEIILSRPC